VHTIDAILLRCHGIISEDGPTKSGRHLNLAFHLYRLGGANIDFALHIVKQGPQKMQDGLLKLLAYKE